MRFRRPLEMGVLLVAVFTGLAAPAPADDEPKVATLAHLKLSGDLDEAPVAVDPLFGAHAENFQSKLDRIKKAQKDSDVQGLVLHIDNLEVGWGKLDELDRAVADFRKAGKKTYAYVESGDTKDYLVALACDEVALPESGWLLLTGLRAEVSYYKDLFTKLGVQADLLQMGDYKGAAEPFTRSGMSPQVRKQLESVLDDYFEKSLIDRIVRRRPARKWTPEHVRKLIDQGPFSARAASAAGLIDRVAYLDQIEEGLKSTLKVDQVKVLKNYGRAKTEEIDLSSPFAFFKLLAPPKATGSKKPKIAVVYATGVINTGKGGETVMGGQACGSETMIKAIRQAEQDTTVKAIVLRVDSPGGSALASDLIWNELNRCTKPVVASMSDTAASGGYYISMAAKKIFAEPGTLTGSIGVFGGKLVIGGLYDTIGLKTETLTRGANANLFATTTPFSKTERAAMSSLMQDTYGQFLEKAVQGRRKAGRQMSRADLEKLAGGRIWTGRQAKENGLVDELGTLGDALAAAKVLAGREKNAEMELLILPKPKAFLDLLLESRSDARLSGLGVGTFPVPRAVPELPGHLKALGQLLRLRGESVWLLSPFRVEVK
jgi:protease-4